MASVALAILACGGNGPADEPQGSEAWVSADRLHRRTCPDGNCGSVGVFFFRQKVVILEERNGWGRVSDHYEASCVRGKSEYVDSGNAACDSTNGIVNGRLAEWVSLEYLTSEQPAHPAESATGYRALVANSDDYRHYADAFAKAAAQLIADGRCTRADFEEMGGWLKSSFHRGQPVYFTYCGEMTVANRLYLDASTGRIFR